MPTYDWNDFEVVASRATTPHFYFPPVPELPEGWKAMDFQLAGAEYILARNHGILGDQPGLTKTAQSVLVSNGIGATSNLVVCPASLRLNWQREIWRWSMIPNVSTQIVAKAKDGVSHRHHYVIISYDLLNNPDIMQAILDKTWDHVILDEAHALKDPKGNRRTKAICGWVDSGTYREGIADVAGRFTLASGTLMPNQPVECYNAIRLTNWDAINQASLDDFRDYYYDFGGGMVRSPVFDPVRQIWKTELHYSTKVRNVPRNLEDLQYRLRKYVMVRRLKDQVMSQLPPKQWHFIPVETTAEIRKALRHPGWAVVEQMYELDPDAFERDIPIDGAISTARLELGEAKAPVCADYIEELLLEGVTKIVVAAWHHTVLDYLRERLAKHGLVYMDGSTSPGNKQIAVDTFQDDPDTKIILGQMIPLGEGWTLTEAQDVVLVEPFWVPGKNDQMLDRIHRMGQKGTRVVGHVPVVPGTMDERIISTAIEKDINIYLATDHQY
jgi:SWI/SNF-related matrix-associated actin-dependent regulator 1 of chromatin subfamily A